MTSSSAIAVLGLTKRFGDHTAVDNATFEVPFGAVTGFIGANGSGKTTTMRSIVGLTIPTSGRVLVDGVPYRSLPDPRRSVGCALDRLGAHPGLTGRQHLTIVATSARIEPHTVAPALELVGLTDAADRRVGSYSTGMKQRLALAVALIAEPRILILDEPARGLDPAGIRWLRRLLRREADRGRAVFVSTHQLAELASIVDRVVFIDQGRVLADEGTADLLEHTRQETLEDAVFALTGTTEDEVQ
ncbi:MAG: ATP-binding cassette domain-containing protein [Actinomycetia bacterium]|nr:ATP-binding cassette domain-containing protein [Actinomycetes bacterium]